MLNITFLLFVMNFCAFYICSLLTDSIPSGSSTFDQTTFSKDANLSPIVNTHVVPSQELDSSPTIVQGILFICFLTSLLNTSSLLLIITFALYYTFFFPGLVQHKRTRINTREELTMRERSSLNTIRPLDSVIRKKATTSNHPHKR